MNRLLTRFALWIPCAAILWTILASDPFIAVAQPAGVSHEIKSWNIDGTVTASIAFGLPDGFVDRVGPVTATTTCGEESDCHTSNVTVTGNVQTGLKGDLEVQLASGETVLSIDVAGQTSSGEALTHTVENYSLSVPRAQSPTMTYDGYEIRALHADGTADVRLTFLVERGDKWPMPSFQIEAWCIAVDPCHAQEIVFPGWEIDSEAEDIHLVHLLVKRMEPGNYRLVVRIRDYAAPWFIDPWTGDHRQVAVYGISLKIPPALPPEIHLDRYDLVGYGDDTTADIALRFVVKRPDAWPMPRIRARLGCSEDETCLVDEVVTPDWVRDQTLDSFHWQLTVNGLAIGSVKLDGTFEAENDPWLGAPRTTTTTDINLEVPEQKEFQVVWRPVTSEVNGYYMDGTASVDLTLAASQLGTEPNVNDDLSAVCYTSADDAELCQTLEPPVAIDIGDDGSLVTLSKLLLPQGSTEVKIVAGVASGETVVNIDRRIVGLSREMWECFLDETRIEEMGGVTCSGFAEPRVRKWTLDTVKIYRTGDPAYVAIFDESLAEIEAITGIEYVIVDDRDSAQVEAYVGHMGDPRIDVVLWEGCANGFSCAWAFSPDDNQYVANRGALSLRHFGDFTPGGTDWLEDGIRYNVVDVLRRTLIPTDYQNRPLLPGLLDRPNYIKPHDKRMYELIYSPMAQPGMAFEDLREFVVLADEALDYKSDVPEPDVVAYLVAKEYFNADSITVEMTGAEMRGSVAYPGPELTVQYADFDFWGSRRAKFSSQNWSSIIFGWDEESWSSAGGRWTQSEAHLGRGRRYRDEIKFDFVLADPTPMLNRYTYTADRIEIANREGNTLRYSVLHHPESSDWPKPTIEIVIDRNSYVIRSYSVQWHFDADNRMRLPYRIEAEDIEYGAAFEIPDEVLETSEYLANLEK